MLGSDVTHTCAWKGNSDRWERIWKELERLDLQESRGEMKRAKEYPNGKDGRDWAGWLNLCREGWYWRQKVADVTLNSWCLSLGDLGE